MSGGYPSEDGIDTEPYGPKQETGTRNRAPQSSPGSAALAGAPQWRCKTPSLPEGCIASYPASSTSHRFLICANWHCLQWLMKAINPVLIHRRARALCRNRSLNHAEYDLRGTLLHGRTHGNLRTYKTEKAGRNLAFGLIACAAFAQTPVWSLFQQERPL
jgi:hypothetical protein